MSRLIAFNLLGRIGAEPMLLAPSYVATVGATIREMMGTTEGGGDLNTVAYLRSVCAAWGADFEERKPYGVVNSVAIIPVHGTLINRFNASWGFVTGYQYIEAAVTAAASDTLVKGIVLDVDSSGGEAQGCFEACDTVYAARSSKPITAIINANAYSAAYAVASAAGRVVVTPSGGAGSIGVVAMHVDHSAALKEEGIKVTFIQAGKHKVDGNPYEPLPASVRADIQDSINAAYAEFVAQVSRNRRLDTEVVRGTEARIYRADEAAAIGLVDAIEAAPAALRAFVTELSGSQQKDYTMNTVSPQPVAEGNETDTAATTAAVEAAPDTPATVETFTCAKAAERERISAIVNSEEAKGRTALASHLALNTDLTPEQALAILSVAPAPVTAASATSPFLAAMNGGAHPEVGPSDEETPADSAASDRVASMLSALSKATGQKFDALKKH